MKQSMTPKEKAKHLALKFTSSTDVVKPNKGSIRMALLCVDVILNEVGAKDWEVDTATKTNYWQDVETELSLLQLTSVIGRFSSKLNKQLEDYMIEVLKRKGFEFDNRIELENFIKSNCRCEDRTDIKQRTY